MNPGTDNSSRKAFWTALVVYAGVGWAAVQILFGIRERLDLPVVIEPVILALFIA